MQRIAYWLTPFIALIVALFLTALLYRVNQVDVNEGINLKREIDNRKSMLDSDTDGWLSRLQESERLGYFFPVNEIYIDVDLNQKIIKETLYRLTAKINDPYQFFCLKEELRKLKLQYLLHKDHNSTLLLVDSKNSTVLEDLIDTLKRYDITASMRPFKKEESWKNIK